MNEERQILEMEDELGNIAFFSVDVIINKEEQTYAVLTHVDEEGKELTDESALFRVYDETEGQAVFEPVTDETEWEEVHQAINDFFSNQAAH